MNNLTLQSYSQKTGKIVTLPISHLRESKPIIINPANLVVVDQKAICPNSDVNIIDLILPITTNPLSISYRVPDLIFDGDDASTNSVVNVFSGIPITICFKYSSDTPENVVFTYQVEIGSTIILNLTTTDRCITFKTPGTSTTTLALALVVRLTELDYVVFVNFHN